MKFKQVITVIGLGASLAAATTACGTKEEAVTTMAETETVAETETETQATESETETLKDEGISDEDIREELERHKEEIQKAGYDHKSVGFVEYYKGLRLNGTDENKAVADAIVHFDELNSAMGELETETETQTGEVYVSNGISEAGNTGSDATGEELTDAEKAAVEQAEIEAQRQAEEAAKAQAEAQRQAEEAAKAQAEAQRQAPVQETPAQPVQTPEQPVQNWENPDGSTNYDAMRAAGYSEEQVQWQMKVDENADRSNPNYGKTLIVTDGGF